MDGTIVRGEALVNQQTMTGEALPVERHAGDQVFAATIVEHGEIHVRVDHLGLDTAVGRIVQAVETAAGEKSDIQKLAERLADRDVGRTLVLAGSRRRVRAQPGRRHRDHGRRLWPRGARRHSHRDPRRRSSGPRAPAS